MLPTEHSEPNPPTITAMTSEGPHYDEVNMKGSVEVKDKRTISDEEEEGEQEIAEEPVYINSSKFNNVTCDHVTL